MSQTTTPTQQTASRATKSAPKQNNVLSTEESDSITSHLGRAVEHVCASVSVLPTSEISDLAEVLEQTAVKLRSLCSATPQASATNWAKQLSSDLNEETRSRLAADNHIGEMQNSVNRLYIHGRLNGTTATKIENVLAKARKEVVGLLE